MSFTKYNGLINLLSMDIEKYAHILDMDETLKSELVKQEFKPFDLLILDDKMRELLQEALSFFIAEQISFNKSAGMFLVSSLNNGNPKVIGAITSSNYEELVDVIKQTNFMETKQKDKLDNKKFANKKAREIYEALESGRNKLKKAKEDSNLNIENIVSSMACFHNSYNLINIWDLTVYQIYDQFLRQRMKHELDIWGLKWAAWGTESFDFKQWYTSLIRD